METLSIENLHDKSVSMIKGRCAHLFLPLLACLLPVLILEVLTFGIVLIFGGFVWQLFDIFMLKMMEQKSDTREIDNAETKDNKEKICYFKTFYSKESYNFGKAFLIGIFKRAAIFAGFVLLIVPGIYLWLSFSFSSFISAENKDAKPIDILLMSQDAVKGYKLQLLRAYAYCSLAILLTAASFGLLSIWTIPYIAAMKCNFYNAMKTGEIPHYNIKETLKIGIKSKKADKKIEIDGSENDNDITQNTETE